MNQTIERPAGPRADQSWDDAKTFSCADAAPRAVLRTLRAIWTHRRAVAHYIRNGDLP
jgi:hypothetical protein